MKNVKKEITELKESVRQLNNDMSELKSMLKSIKTDINKTNDNVCILSENDETVYKKLVAIKNDFSIVNRKLDSIDEVVNEIAKIPYV